MSEDTIGRIIIIVVGFPTLYVLYVLTNITFGNPKVLETHRRLGLALLRRLRGCIGVSGVDPPKGLDSEHDT